MKLIEAKEADGPRLSRYFEETALTGRVTLKLERKNNFFTHYSIQSDEHCTYMLVDEKKDQIQAMVTMVFRDACISGEPTRVAFATDLRVSAQRNVIMRWSQYMMPTLKRESEERGCKHVFSVVNEWHSQAYNAFVRPRTIRRDLPRYYLFRRFEAVCLHGLWPFAQRPLETITLRFAREADRDQLSHYVSEKMKSKVLSFNYTPELFNKNLQHWSQLQIADFLLALDSQNQIIGCTALWNPTATQEFRVMNYDAKVSSLKEGLHFLSLLGWSRRLSNVGEKLNCVILSFLLANNPDIFHALLHRAFHSVTDEHFLIYPHFEGSLLTQPPKGFIHSQFRGGLYCVLAPGDTPPGFLRPKLLNEGPEFDLAFW